MNVFNFQIFKLFNFQIVFFFISIFIISCAESSIVGLNVQPTTDLLNVTYQDTATLLTKTVKMDSLRTDEIFLQSITTDALLGTYLDPIFGKTTASLYTQLMLNTDNPGFGTNPTIDSVVLSLVYDPSYCYGKAEHVAQNINVYELSQDLVMGNSYYSVDSLSTSTVDLASSYRFIPNPTAIVYASGDTLEPQLRIRLDKTFGQTILNEQGTANLANDTAFHSYLKGFYITTEKTNLSNGQGNIVRFNLADSQTKLTLFYHSDSGDSLSYDFNTGGVAHFSRFKHIHSTIDPNLALQLSSNPPAQNDVVFIQSMAGTKVKIEIPYILDWNKSLGINKAELVIKIDTTTATYQLDTFAAPANLMLYGINDDGSNFLLPDFYEGSNYFDGIYNAITKEYNINISRYIQQILNGKLKNNGLDLVVFNGATNASRIVVGGGGKGSAYQMKLSITSTKLP
jgi:hypothetical protein